MEGPGRRVGYDNFTAIDWIFEYTKERQRIRHLQSNNPGILGHIRQLLDAGHIWVVLIVTGLAVGLLAACIDIASSWLADIKEGFCQTGDEGGRFYLNRTFCCWGYEGMNHSLPISFPASTNRLQIYPSASTGSRGGMRFVCIQREEVLS